jgi:hypothetical protein
MPLLPPFYFLSLAFNIFPSINLNSNIGTPAEEEKRKKKEIHKIFRYNRCAAHASLNAVYAPHGQLSWHQRPYLRQLALCMRNLKGDLASGCVSLPSRSFSPFFFAPPGDA